jgi:alkanesulfonate monooxygenase SsuD/methylene tetrahydromethanopterin reductase-like flavin-dependent oxidoreductase (luciferase family)
MIPIEVGGASKAALRRAGRLGDGWIEIGSGSLEDARAKLDVIEAHRREAGRDTLPFEVTLGGAYGRDLDGIRRCDEAGATRIVVAPLTDRGISLETVIDFTKRFADEVITKL